MRRRARVDGNHRQLFDLARQLGGYVQDTAQIGSGCPDAFVWTRDKGWTAVEVKVRQGRLTEAQRAIHRTVPVCVWREAKDVLAHFGVEDA